MKDMEYTAKIVLQLDKNITSLKDSYRTVICGIGLDTSRKEREARVDKWCAFIADWPKIAELHYLGYLEAVKGTEV